MGVTAAGRQQVVGGLLHCVRVPVFSTAHYTFHSWRHETIKTYIPITTQELKGTVKEKCARGLRLTARLFKGQPSTLKVLYLL